MLRMYHVLKLYTTVHDGVISVYYIDMKISTSDLLQKLKSGALRVVTEQEAEYFAQETVEAHLRKAPRTNPLKASIGDLQAAMKHKDNNIKYTVDLPSFVSIDFQRQGPLAYIKKIHDELEERSYTNGMAMAAFTNSQSMHTLHIWVQGLAKRGLVAIAVCNGGPSVVVPYGGTRGVFGTNPMAFGIPGENKEIHCVDMATSQIPFFEFMDSLKNDKPLQQNAAVDRNGLPTVVAKDAIDPTTNPNDPVSNILPMGGGYKGYYLVYLLELLTSGLIGMPASTEMSEEYKPEEHGAILIVFNPSAMASADKLITTVQSLHKSINNQAPKPGDKVRIPGEENNKRYKELKNSKIDIDDSLIEKLDKLLK